MMGQIHALKTFLPVRQKWQGVPRQNRDGMEKGRRPKKGTVF